MAGAATTPPRFFTISAPAKTRTWADQHTHITLKYKGDIREGTRAPLYRMQRRGLGQEMLKVRHHGGVEGYPSTQKAARDPR
jgi:hypothetical protein